MSPTRARGDDLGRSRRARRLGARGAALGLLLIAATGCSTASLPKFGWPHPITDQAQRSMNLWQGSWVAAWAVGILVWGLILWCVVAYRKRGDHLPAQVHYNLPIEILYTIVPFVIIAVLFYFTARDESYLDKTTANPQCTVGVVGFQWAWQFNYEKGCQGAQGLQIVGRPGQISELVLPSAENVLFKETSPDVIHSWWVPAFGFKRDVVPGRTNKFEINLKKGQEGVYEGRCAELCGEFHDRMLFKLRIVSPEEFQTFVTQAKADTTSGKYSTIGSNQ